MSVEIEPLEQATQLLGELLSAGPLPAETIRKQLEAHGIPETIGHHARTNLGIVSIRRWTAGQKAWLWALPTDPRLVDVGPQPRRTTGPGRQPRLAQPARQESPR